jgi:hypothetical protein
MPNSMRRADDCSSSAPSSTGGGFSAYDFKAKREIPLTLKGIAPSRQAISAKYVGKNLALDVVYSVKNGSIRVDGTLSSLADVERAIVLTYTIPMSGANLRFAPSMNKSIAIGEKGSGSGTVYPIGAEGSSDSRWRFLRARRACFG